MAEVTIKAQQSFGKIRAGETVTVERTDYVDRQIRNGRVVVVDDESGDPVPPGRNAPRNDWATYLELHHPEIEIGEQTRGQLIEAYDAATVPTTDTIDDTGPVIDDDQTGTPPIVSGEQQPPVGDSADDDSTD